MDFWQAWLLAAIEGITEYLPISSTGHLILASAVMGLNEDPFTKSFNIVVQFGAILSVVWLYWPRLKAPMSFYIKIVLGFLPAAVIGLLLKDRIDQILGSVEIVAYALVIGGLVLIGVDGKGTDRGRPLEHLSYPKALVIGFIQCFAFIPGVSRSAASILGGMFMGLDRKSAAEYSFFLAVPTLAGATLIKSLKIVPTLTKDQMLLILGGNIISFVIGSIAIKSFIQFISQKGFRFFGIYRVIVGLIFLGLLWSGTHFTKN
jgi:undecaprenyl-diphosphatase